MIGVGRWIVGCDDERFGLMGMVNNLKEYGRVFGVKW